VRASANREVFKERAPAGPILALVFPMASTASGEPLGGVVAAPVAEEHRRSDAGPGSTSSKSSGRNSAKCSPKRSLSRASRASVDDDEEDGKDVEMVGGCCVCSDERGWDENPLVYCDGEGCNVAVHQGNQVATMMDPL